MGRSPLISIPSTPSLCRTACIMKKTFLLILLGLVTLALSENQEEKDENELEEFMELTENEDDSLENSRLKRDAEPKKRRNAKKKGKGKGKPRKSSKRDPRKKNKPKGDKGGKGGNGSKRKSIKRKAKKNKPNGGKGGKGIKRKGSKRMLKGGQKANGKRKPKRKGQSKRKVGRHQLKGLRNAGCARAVNSTCLDTAVMLLKIVSSRITNFLVQQKRIAKFNNTRSKKSGKKGLFGPIASKVIDVGGGNASDLSCSGNKTNAGATKLKEIITNLQKCEENIKNACDTSAYPHPNMTQVNECKTNMESMKTSVDACAKKTGDEACTCWMDSSLKATAEKVKTCDIATENKKVTAAHKQCTGNFSACKKIEDTAVTYIFACSQSANDLKVKAAQTKKNVDALDAAKTKTSTLAGSSSGRSTVIRKRATSVSTCSDFVTLSAKLLTAADEAPTSSAVETMAKILSAVSDTLSCSTAEKSTLTVQVTTYTQTISKVTATYNGLKASVEDASGTTSDADIVAAGEAATTSTKKVVAKRNRLVRDILSNLN